jgi:hypothetical protein
VKLASFGKAHGAALPQQQDEKLPPKLLAQMQFREDHILRKIAGTPQTITNPITQNPAIFSNTEVWAFDKPFSLIAATTSKSPEAKYAKRTSLSAKNCIAVPSGK